jgi:hypothetical protein
MWNGARLRHQDQRAGHGQPGGCDVVEDGKLADVTIEGDEQHAVVMAVSHQESTGIGLQ